MPFTQTYTPYIKEEAATHSPALKPKKGRIVRVIIFIFLTALTQIGGIVFAISLALHKLGGHALLLKPIITFPGLYLVATFIIVPVVAPLLGRERAICTKSIRPATFMTVLLNRNYVTKELNELLKETGRYLEGSGIDLVYLDASFPFIDGFTLLPHRSHTDGRKIDVCLVYEDSSGKLTNRKKSVSGYGIFENPRQGEFDQVQNCLAAGFFQYDYPKYFTFGAINPDLNFSVAGTRELLESILKCNHLGKLFLEPHLVQRLNLDDRRIRYHGCRSVRHDDHIHVQL